MFDFAVHVRADMVEPLRVMGNVAGIAAALIVLLGFAKSVAPQILAGAATAVILFNALFMSEEGFEIPMLVFIGVSLLLLIRWAQVKATAAFSIGEETGTRFYHRWWFALLAALVGTALVLLSGLSEGSLGAAFTGDEPQDSTPAIALPREADGHSAELLSAFFGLDDNLPRTASANICPNDGNTLRESEKLRILSGCVPTYWAPTCRGRATDLLICGTIHGSSPAG